MKQKVFILATCRKPELLPYTLLVFKTLRVGFPTAEVSVHLNGAQGSGMNGWAMTAMETAQMAGCKVEVIAETTHHEWIENLILDPKNDEFWILDTDVIFYASVEDWTFGTPLAGALIPEFNDPFLCATTRSRLHTSLMHIKSDELNVVSLAYEYKHPRTIYNPMVNGIYPQCYPLNGKSYFNDTMSLVYHAVGGTPFTAQQKDCYFHFHFGSFSDMVLPKMPDGIGAARQQILEHPEQGVGQWRTQEEWFNAMQPVDDGIDVIAPIHPKDAEDARAWNHELCCGNQSAMACNDLYYNYCHAIDDLLDTMRDGRPRMSKDQILSTYFNAALFYNSSFFVANREMLFPIILDITSTYAVSVGWENSSKLHLRKIADVFRTTGNRFYYMVALLCGGEAHALNMIRRVHERDWLGQHDKAGNPV